MLSQLSETSGSMNFKVASFTKAVKHFCFVLEAYGIVATAIDHSRRGS